MFESIVSGQPVTEGCRGLNTSVFGAVGKSSSWKDICPGATSEVHFVEELEVLLWNLRDRLLVGITERFDVSLVVFREQAGKNFNITDLRYCPKNVVVGGRSIEELPESVVSYMRSRNALDASLLEAASRVLSRRARFSQFEAEIEEFQADLHYYQAKRNCTFRDIRNAVIKSGKNGSQRGDGKNLLLATHLADPDYSERNKSKLCSTHGP